MTTTQLEMYGIESSKLPRFAIKIFNEKRFSDEAKIEFRDIFLIPYLEDENIQKNSDGYVLLFSNYRFKNIYKDVDEAMEDTIVNKGDVNWCYQIGNSGLFQYKSTCIRTNHSSKNKYGPFLVSCNLHIGSSTLADTAIRDSGCQMTSLFPDKIWDYNLSKFKETINRVFLVIILNLN